MVELNAENAIAKIKISYFYFDLIRDLDPDKIGPTLVAFRANFSVVAVQ